MLHKCIPNINISFSQFCSCKSATSTTLIIVHCSSLPNARLLHDSLDEFTNSILLAILSTRVERMANLVNISLYTRASRCLIHHFFNTHIHNIYSLIYIYPIQISLYI